MIGKTISHYQILEKLGEGGMGIVYKAEDIKLKRTVALKFLPHHLLANKEDKTRFLHEAQSASALNHPNIMTIHEIDEVDEKAFIVMEYVDGENLKDKVEKGPLKTKELLNIAIAVADGLNAAHEQEIVHRDIKSENIMISKAGLVKIMDFGLAKRKGMSRITKTGSTLGTLAYMSPEQAEGLKVDRRSDLFSYGVVMYEMATGQLPFKGEHDAAILYSIVNEAPLPVTTLNPNIPKELERFIHKALEKEAEDRYQHADDLSADLKKLKKDLESGRTTTITTQIPQKQEKSIVVLPFVNMSPDPDQEYFSDGLTEEIITDLSQIHDLLVISRSSAMTFKGTKKKIKEIAREVNVQYILEGSVRKAGNNLRITAQLIDATTDAHLWAEKYSGTLDDVFDIQERVSRSIVDALKIKLSSEENKKIAERPIGNVHAYECHLRAIYNIWLTTEEGLERALQFINTGLDIIGKNEILYADKGQVYIHYVDFVVGKDENYLTKAEECVKEIFTLNPESAHGHFLNGLIIRNRGHAQKSVKEFKKAIQIYPEDPNFLLWLSWVYGHSGQGSAARTLSNKLLEIDPISPVSHMGIVDLFEGKFNTATKSLKKCNQLEEGNPFYRFWYAKALAYNLSIEKALEMFKLIEKETPNTIWSQLGVFFTFALQSKKAEALKSVTEQTKKMFQNDEMFPIWMAESYALINEKEEAIKWLEYGIDWGFINYPFLNEYNPFLKNIRGDERFKKLMERVKYEWENFDV